MKHALTDSEYSVPGVQAGPEKQGRRSATSQAFGGRCRARLAKGVRSRCNGARSLHATTEACSYFAKHGMRGVQAAIHAQRAGKHTQTAHCSCCSKHHVIHPTARPHGGSNILAKYQDGWCQLRVGTTLHRGHQRMPIARCSPSGLQNGMACSQHSRQAGNVPQREVHIQVRLVQRPESCARNAALPTKRWQQALFRWNTTPRLEAEVLMARRRRCSH